MAKINELILSKLVNPDLPFTMLTLKTDAIAPSDGIGTATKKLKN